jgi:hypothetical protein
VRAYNFTRLYPHASYRHRLASFCSIISLRGNGGQTPRRSGYLLVLPRQVVDCYRHYDSDLQTDAHKPTNLLHRRKPPRLFSPKSSGEFPPLPFHIIQQKWRQNLWLLKSFGGRIATCDDYLSCWLGWQSCFGQALLLIKEQEVKA